MIDNIFCFLIGFILGVLFIVIIKSIKKLIYKRSKKLQRKAFAKQMKDLEIK